MHVQLMRLGPAIQRVNIHPLIPQLGQGVHQQAVARGRAQGIHNVNLPLGILLHQLRLGQVRRIGHAGQAGGQANMQNILALLQKGREIRDKLVFVHLAGLGLRAFAHGLIKIREGNALAQVIGILHAVQIKMKADVMDVPLLEMLLAQICRGAAAQNVIAHGFSPPLFAFSDEAFRGAVPRFQSPT